MRAVNLLPKDAGRSARKRPKPAPLIGIFGAAAVVVGGGALFVTASRTLSARQHELAARQAEYAAAPRPAVVPATPAPSRPDLAAERGPRVAAVSSALAQRVSWDRVLRRFSLVLPDDIWLQSLALKNPSASAPVATAATPAAADAAAAAPAQGFSITGRTYSHAGVARLLARLTAVPDLENVQLLTSQRLAESRQGIVEFTIAAAVRGDGASSR
jgi:Tfp pilus assembly protein PilN